MLEILKNPKTENYQKLKNSIFDNYFPWFYQKTSTTGEDNIPGHTNIPFYCHTLLDRPDKGKKYTESKSSASQLSVAVVSEILQFNNPNAEFFFLRMSVNATYHVIGNQFTIPHNDHSFPHTNFICYLTDNHGGGRTFVEGHQPYEPVEDECIVFTGEHYMELPRKGRRVNIVATLISY
jgi:hypothetical protein